MKFVEVMYRTVNRGGHVQATEVYIHPVDLNSEGAAVENVRDRESEKFKKDGFELWWDFGEESFRAEGKLPGNLYNSTIYVTFKAL